MKKEFYQIVFSLLLCQVLGSCTEVIDLDLNASNPQVVVEATIVPQQPTKVLLSKSIGLNDGTDFPHVEGASVLISDDAGNSEQLIETSPGVYQGSTIKGVAGRNYELKIACEGKTISARSTLPNKISIESLDVFNSIYPGGGAPQVPEQPAYFYEVKLKYTDPSTENNYYRILLTVNGVSAGSSVFDDRLTNGQKIENMLVIYDPTIQSGDTIGVEMQSIDESVYKYYKTMGGARGFNASAPANPTTNLTGAALGYFSAYVSDWKSYVLP